MKPEFMRLRRALAGTVAALLLAVGIVALSPALSASAHHNTITVSASCENDTWTITWTIINSEWNKSEQITSSSDPSAIPVGTTIAAGGSYTSEEIVAEPVDKTLTIQAKWSNGVKHTASKSISRGDFHGTCEPSDNPQLNANAAGCVAYGAATGTVTYTLSGVKSSYTIELRRNGGAIQTASSGAGTAQFANVGPGTYTVSAHSSQSNVETPPFTVVECAPHTPAIQLVVEPCVTGGSLGAVTANLSNLNTGVTYRLALRSDDGTVLQTLDRQATSASLSASFDKRGPGTYYVTAAIGNGAVLESSARATIKDCTQTVTPEIVVELEPCVPSMLFSGGNGGSLATAIAPMAPAPAERAIRVTVSDLAPSTVYTVQLVTADAAATVIATTVTPGDSATSFTHLFTAVPSPGDYKVNVLGSTAPLVSDSITAPLCDLDTLAPPSIELISDQCDGSGNGIGALSARVIDLDATKTYYVRIVDAAGATALGGDDRAITGSTTATLEFPDVTTTGTYTAQLLIDPGKQLAATSPAAVDFSVCLPTLAMTGPGVLLPLGSVAALLLTLGGAVVTGRLRRRMAL